MSKTEQGHGRDEDDGVSLIELLLVLARHKMLLLLLPLLFALVAGVYARLATKMFTAETVMMPPQQQQSSASAMLAQLGGFGGMAGGALGLKNPSEMYIGMLRSRTVGEHLAKRFKLAEAYEMKKPAGAWRLLHSRTEIAAGKDGLITISVEDASPQRAAALANAYVDELRRMTRGLAVTEAQQRRLFFENQLRDAKNQLTDAEVALKQIQQKTGILDVASQSQATIMALTQLKATIAGKEVELAAMRSFATASNPDYVRVQNELSSLRGQLQQLTSGHDEGDVLIIKSKAPQLALDYVRKLRDVKYQETLFEIIAKQYEIARLDEAKEGAVIQVIDPAVAPERKSKPKSVVLVATGFMVGLLLAILLIFIRHAIRSASSGPDGEKMRELRAALRWRRPAA